MNLQGRGFDGFYAMQTYDSRNGLYDYKYYAQTFPTTSMVLKDELSQNSTGSVLVSTTVYTPAITTLNSGSYNERYFPYVSQSVESDNEVGGSDNGNPITQVTRTYVYDTYGNATSVTTATTDEDVSSPWYTLTWQTQVAKTITPNTGDWCLNLPTQITVEKTVPGSGGGSLTRTTSLTPDYVNCRISSRIDEPSSSTIKVTTVYGFDGCGNVNSVAVTGVSMATRTTSANFGTHCESPESITNPQNETTTIGYNYALGVPTSTADPNDLTTSWLYDNYGRKTQESRPDGTSTTYAITACPAPSYCGVSDLRWYVLTKDLGTTGAQIRLREPFFDGFDRQRYDERVNLTGAVTKTAWLFDQLGNKKELYDPWISSANGYHLYTHDVINRLTVDAAYQAGGTFYRQSTIGYAGRTLTFTDPKSNVTTKQLDVLGNVRNTIDPSPGGTTSAAYEPFGNVSSLTDAASNVTSWTYDLRGHLIARSDPDRGSWTFTPDSLGETVSQTDAKSQTTTFVYDKLSRMTSRTEAEGTSTWVWGSTLSLHNFDRLQSMSGPGYSESSVYDSFARLTTTTYTADTTYTVTRVYNTTTQMLDNLTYPASLGASPLRIQYGYTNGIMSSINDYNTPSTVYWTMATQDAHWNPTEEIFANGVTVLANYDDLTGHLNWRQSGNASPYANQQNLSYSWDLNENLTDRIDANQGNLDEHFNYDALNRLQSSTLAGNTNFSVNLDVTGNITSTSANGTYTYNATHKHAVASTSNGWSFTYDNNGNMLTGRGGTLTWTSYNLPSSVTNGTASSAFSYTPDRRYWQQAAQYSGGPETTIYIGGLFEKVTTSATTDYHHLIRAGSVIVVLVRSTGTNNQTYYVTGDHLGSSSVITNTAGSEVLNESFSPYGVRRGSNWSGSPSSTDWSNIASTTRHGFTSHTMLDNLNLIHMNGRVFDGQVDRFVSADPTLDGASSQTINPYGYVGNNPLSATDPTGFCGSGDDDCKVQSVNGQTLGDSMEMVDVTASPLAPDPGSAPSLDASLGFTGFDAPSGGSSTSEVPLSMEVITVNAKPKTPTNNNPPLAPIAPDFNPPGPGGAPTKPSSSRSSALQAMCKFGAKASDAPDLDMAGAIGMFGDASDIASSIPSLAASARGVSPIIGNIGVAVSAGEIAGDAFSGQYGDMAFDSIDLVTGLMLARLGTAGFILDGAFIASGGSKASAERLAALACLLGGGD
jgi:RHS repeat-associated protein